MEEQNKSVRDTLIDLNKKIDELTGKPVEKKKFKFNVSFVGWLFSLIIAGFVFTMLWIFWSMTNGIIGAIFALLISLFISHRLNDGQWRLPFKSRFLGKRKKRKGYVVFMNIGMNKAITFIKAPIEEGVAMVNNIPHVINPDDILIWKNKIPIVIQPQWAERPFSAPRNFAETRANGETTEGWEYIMNYILKTQLKSKKDVPMGLIIFGVIALVGLAYYLIKSGAFS